MKVERQFFVWVIAAILLCAVAAFAATASHPANLDGIYAKKMAGKKLTDAEVALINQASGVHGGNATTDPRPPHHVLDDYVAVDTTYSWIDMTGATTITGIADDDNVGPYAVGFTFPYFGNNYTQMYVNSNGSISPTDTNWYNIYNPLPGPPCIPHSQLPNNSIYGWWGDLDPSTAGGGTVKYRSDVAEGRFIVAWEGVPYWVATGDVGSFNFQIVVRSDGTILVNYGTFGTPGIYGDSCFAGIENTDGSQGVLLWCCNSQLGMPPQPNTAIRYLQPNGVPQVVTNLQGTANGTNVTLTWTDPTHDTNGNLLTPDSILIYRTDTQPASQIGHVTHGIQTFTVTGEPQGLVTYYVRAKASTWLGAASNVSVPVGNPSYVNDFDTDDGDWTADGVWAWGVATNAGAPTPHSGTGMWGVGMDADYGNSVCGHLDLNLGQQVASTTASLEFWYWYEVENAFDGCNVKVSVDDGTTWELVTPAGNYPGTTNAVNTCNPSEAAWTGSTTPQWRYATIPLGSYVATTPIFRFTFGSDPSVTYSGFFFDDMIIWGLQPPADGIPLPVTNLAGNAGGTTTVTLTWTDPNHDTNGNPMVPDSVLIYRGNALPGSQIGHAAGGAQTIAIPNQPLGNVVYYVRAKHGTYLSLSTSVGVLVGSPSYSNNFDTDDGDWSADGVWEWGAPTNSAGPQPHSGTNVWAVGLTATYSNSVCGHLDLNPGLRVNSAAASVEFYCWYQTEQVWDGVNLQASVDSGVTWTIIPCGYSGVSNGVWSCGTNPDSVWTGTGTSWRHVVADISGLMGQIPIFRLQFGSDGSGTGAGFFLDDMLIWGLAPRQAIVGTVRHDGGSNPVLAGAWVRAGNDSVQTDALGQYVLSVEPGTYTVRYRHPTHCDSVRTGVVVTAGQNTTVNLNLLSPTAVLSASSLTFVVNRNQQATQPLVIRNTGSCPLHFVVSDSVTWLDYAPASGDVAPNDSVTVNVTVSPGISQPGDYETTLRVTGNAPGSPFAVHVDMSVLTVSLVGGTLPTVFALHPNYPNPFNPTTMLPFDVPQQSHVDIVVFNVMGQEVVRLVNGNFAAGRYQASFDATELPSGLYLVRMTSGSFTSMNKMMLLK